MKLKLCNNGQSVVGTNEQGNNVSFTVDAEEYKQWLAEGNTPESEFTEDEILTQKQNEFRLERNLLLDKVDKDINKAEDLGKDSTVLRTYRQALRDATITWVIPEGIL